MTDTAVGIAVLTYKRPDDLAALLPDLEQQVAGIEGRTFDVIVIDNDPDQSARQLVQAYPWDLLRYVHEPQPGIAHARNRALTETAAAQLLVFIDDDERPTQTWLSSLLAMHDRTGAAAVTGPVFSDYEVEPDAWLRATGFVIRREFPDGHELPAAGTGNLLLDLRQVRELGLTFDDRFGLSGGSDTMFTRQLVKGGGRILYAASAGITDKVPAARMTRAWRRQRYYRVGNTWSRTSIELADGPAARLVVRLRLSAIGAGRAAFGLTRAALGLFTRDLQHRARGEREVARGLGAVAGAWGSVHVEYRRPSGRAPDQSALRRAYHRGRRLLKRLAAHLRLAALGIRNLTTKQSVVGNCEVIVSLTSFSARIGKVGYAIESLARGTARPRRMILWLADNEQFDPLPASLERLRRRGLEIRTCPDYGSHKKYFPTLPLALADQLPIVTADDDILYPTHWLERLAEAGARQPELVSCYRASRIVVTGGKIAPYATWPRCRDDRSGFAVFPTSGAGAYYPLPMIRALADEGEAFLEAAPKADDVWLHWVAIRSGIRMRQIFRRAQLPPATPGTQQVSLMTENVFGGRNDRYLQSLYEESDIARIGGGDGAPRTR